MAGKINTALLLAACLLAACSEREQESLGPLAGDDGFPREVNLPGGGMFRVESFPERIVSLTLGTDEILLELVDPSRIAALSTFADDPELSNIAEKAKAVEKRVIAGAEQVIALRPDLIFAASYSRPEFFTVMETVGLPVFKFEAFDTIGQILANVECVGLAVGEENKARSLADDARDRIAAVSEAVKGQKRPSVLSMSYGFVAGENTTVDELIEIAGGQNYACEKGIEGHKEVSSEVLLAWDPDFLLLIAQDKKGALAEDYPESLSPALAEMAPVKDDRIIWISGRLLSPVSHYIADGVEELATLLHPDCFPQVEAQP
jgi:iron complex transport system substrate-binding protein